MSLCAALFFFFLFFFCADFQVVQFGLETDLEPVFLLEGRQSFASGLSQLYRGVLVQEVGIQTEVHALLAHNLLE